MFLNDKGTTQTRVTIILPDKKESQTDRMNEKNYNNFFLEKVIGTVIFVDAHKRVCRYY